MWHAPSREPCSSPLLFGLEPFLVTRALDANLSAADERFDRVEFEVLKKRIQSSTFSLHSVDPFGRRDAVEH